MQDRILLTHTITAAWIIAFVGIGFVLFQAQAVLAPIFSAIVLGVVFAPATDRIVALGLKPSLAAFCMLLFLACGTGAVILSIGPSVSAAVTQAPVIWAEMEDIFEWVRDAVSGVQQMQDTVEDALVAEESGSETPPPASDTVALPSLFDALSYGPSMIAAVLIFCGTLYFFLAGREDLYRLIGRVFRHLSTASLYDAEARVAKYFLTITAINAGLGTLFAALMALIGMPEPVMWGLGAFLLNFILYLGPALMAVALVIAGTVAFDGAMSFAPLAIYVTCNMTEAQFVTPSLVGQQMALNPLFIFLSLVIWLWLWGPIGGIVAIPIVVWSMFVLSEARDDALSGADAAAPS